MPIAFEERFFWIVACFKPLEGDERPDFNGLGKEASCAEKIVAELLMSDFFAHYMSKSLLPIF